MISIVKTVVARLDSSSKRQRKDSFLLLRQLILAVAFCLCSAGSRAATFAWDPSPDAATPGMVAGYKLYYSTQLFTALPLDVATNSAFTIVTVGNQTSVTISNLLPGQTYYFAVTAFNSDGEESDLSNILPFTEGVIGNQPPIVALTSPANNASFLAGEVVTISATASDPDGTVASVEFLDGVTSLGTDSSSPFSMNITTLPPGLHTITAMATDDKGVVTVSAVATITINVNQPPTVALTSPAANSSFYTNEVVTITASAGDSDGTITKVEFFDGAALISSDTASPYTMNVSTLAAGTHTITARATDNKGAATTSQLVTVTIKVNQNPTIALAAPLHNSTFFTNEMVSITGTASDSDGTIAKVEFFDGGTLIGTKSAEPFTITTSSLTAGTHTLTAKATDDRGASATSGASTITIKVNQAPTIVLTSPAANSSFYTNEVVTLSATASDSDGTIAKVEFFDGVTLIGTKSSAPYTITTSGLSAGAHTLTAKATDDRGATATSGASTITIKVNQAPTVVLTSPAANSSFYTNEVVTLSATASDSDGTVAKVEFFDGAALLGTDTAAPYSLTISSLAPGSHAIVAKATDDRGTVTSSQTAAITIKVNQLPNIALTSPGNNSTFLLGAPVSFGAFGSDPDGSIAKVEFLAGSTVIGSKTSSPWSITFSGLPAGSHSITARATDNRGSAGVSEAVTITIKDNQAPTVVLTELIENSIRSSPLFLSASASDSDGTIASVEFFAGEISLGVDSEAPFSISAMLPSGFHNFTARATDNDGAVTTSLPVRVGVKPTSPGNLKITAAQ